MNRSWLIVSVAAFTGLSVSQGWAVKPAVFEHTQPKDFTAGKLDNVVVSSLGEVTLGRETKTIQKLDEDIQVVNALARAGDGIIYAATGPNGQIYKIDGEKVSEFAKLPEGGTIFSLLFDREGKLLAGTGGHEQAKIYKIDGTGKAELFYEPPEAKYVWALARGSAGEIYAATGTEGQLHVIDADGKKGQVVVDLKPKNLLCLSIGPDGLLYAGTDQDGLVYRINPSDQKAFVLYDAKEEEISSIVIDAEGNVFASTASADQARPGRAIADKPGGKPENAETKPANGNPSPPQTQPGDTHDAKQESAKKKNAVDDIKKPALNALSHKRLGRPVANGGSPEGGNAIYRIDIDGLVTEVFRKPVMILAMVEADGIIYAATGNEGRIYALNPTDERTTMLAKLEASQVTAILRLPNDRLIVGTANEPMLVHISDQFAGKGTLVSEPLDADQIVKWGQVSWKASIPEGTKLTIATRSSNVEDEESEAWEEYSAEIDATSPQQIPSVSARFLQYRITFETSIASVTPTFRELKITRIEENRPPRISTLGVISARQEAQSPGSSSAVKALVGSSGFGNSKPAGPDHYWVVKWEAEDPNKDPLEYQVFFRQVGSNRWVQLAKAKELKKPPYIWDTRTVADGKYEVRVVASDSKGNPPSTELSYARISDPVTVDNTPPKVVIQRIEPKGNDALEIHAELRDMSTPLIEASYSVDSSEKWVPLLANDDIFDSMNEAVTFTIDNLEPGEHWLTLRVRDEQRNTTYQCQSTTVGE